MFNILLFGGTSEGRRLTELFTEQEQVRFLVCVATEYGETMMAAGPQSKASALPGRQSNTAVRTGRMDEAAMRTLMKEQEWDLVIDATHPYAGLVSEQIRRAADSCGLSCLRLLRAADGSGDDSEMIWCPTVEAAVAYLNQYQDQYGSARAFVTTGSKEAEKYLKLNHYHEQLTIRILPVKESVEKCLSLGLEGRNLICMQGPFTEEMNYQMLRDTKAEFLVTKESGAPGGFREKISAAKRAGARVIVIGRPAEDHQDTHTFRETVAEIERLSGCRSRRTVTLAGVGTGNREHLTLGVMEAIRRADVLIGARRLLEQDYTAGKPVFASYKPDQIYQYIEQHPEYLNIVILLSGDSGFYSGAAACLEALKEYQPVVLPGLSSVSVLAAKLGVSWSDAGIYSFHGREGKVLPKLGRHCRLFLLVSSGEQIQELLAELNSFGMGEIRVAVGQNLGSAQEVIDDGLAKDLVGGKFADLAVVYLEQQRSSKEHDGYSKASDGYSKVPDGYGLPDECFIRGKVPMTKSEVRSIVLSKLALPADAVVYDIGAGTGSVALEAARIAEAGMVYAIEKEAEALQLIEQNRRHLKVSNLEIIHGTAPDLPEDLPVPTHVFIGGSSGRMAAILDAVKEKSPAACIVVTAIVLETMSEVLAWCRCNHVDVEAVQVSVTRTRSIGKKQVKHMMEGMNPVWIMTITGGDRA